MFFYTGDCYSNGHFQCANSDKCVQIIYKCDGNVDCPEGEDEPSNCATGRNKMNKQNIQQFWNTEEPYIANSTLLKDKIVFVIWTPCYICIILYLYNIYFFMYIIILAINCHGLFCLWVVSLLQCRSSIFVFILFIYVLYVTNHQNHCKCKMQMSVILCSHWLLDWFNKTILFYSVLHQIFSFTLIYEYV